MLYDIKHWSIFNSVSNFGKFPIFTISTFLTLMIFLNYRSSHWRCSVKKVFLEILQNSQENICIFCEYCEIYKNTFLQNTSGRLLLKALCDFQTWIITLIDNAKVKVIFLLFFLWGVTSRMLPIAKISNNFFCFLKDNLYCLVEKLYYIYYVLILTWWD